MTYKVDLLDSSTLTKINEIEVVNEPTIHEEINGSFTLDFEAHYTAKNDLTNDVIVAVDGKYFKIAKVVRSRSGSISLSVHCEHISYDLIVDYELDEDMEFESDVRTMIERFLSGTRFTLVDCMQTDVKYYATKTLDIRKRLFEVANLFAGELVFDNYNVSLVQQRGSNKGLEIELGVNLIGVTEEKDFVEGITSYELDLLDLSNVPGYEDMDFSSAEIGDTITIIDSVLGIHTTERILAIDYNPFQKALPTVTVGDYIRDLTEYIKPEEEDEEDETAHLMLSEFRVGNINCLELSGVEIDPDELIEDGGGATIDVNEYETLTGLHVRLKPSYSSYHVTIYQMTKDNYTTMDYATNQGSLNSMLLPTEDITGFGVLVTEVPLSEFDADKHKFGQYGVKFNAAALDVFREVRVGDINALKEDGSLLIAPFNLPEDISVELGYEEGTTLTGLFISMKQNYRNWNLQITTFDEAGTPTTAEWNTVESAARTWQLPNENIKAIAITASDGAELSQTVAFSFMSYLPEEESFLEGFKIGEIDVLSMPGVEIILDEEQEFNVEMVSVEIEYDEPDEHKGLFLKLKERYKTATIEVTNLTGTTVQRSDSVKLPGTHTGLVVKVTYGAFVQYYGVKFKQVEFEGLIVVKCRDDKGVIFETKEIEVNEPETPITITPEDIYGYDLVSTADITVVLTRKEPKKEIYIDYTINEDEQDEDDDGMGSNGYRMEFITASLTGTSSNFNVTFSKAEGYDEVKTTTYGFMGSTPANASVLCTPIRNTATNKFTGLNVRVSGGNNSLSVCIHAICYNAPEEEPEEVNEVV